MGGSRLIRCFALCSVALACHTRAPEGPIVSAPPRAAVALVENEPSAPAAIEAIPTASPEREPAPPSAPSGAPAASSDDSPGRLSTPSGLQRKPRARLQTVVVESGPIEAHILTRIIQQRLPEIRDCYTRRLERRPELEGQLHFRLRLASNGDVTNAEAVVHTLGDAEALSCVRAIMFSLVLPAPDPPAVIVVPLTFAP